MEITELLARPHHMNSECVTPCLGGFAAKLASVGHTWLTINDFLTSAIHFGGWLQASGLHLVDVDEETVKAFGAHRCECPGGRSQKYVSRAYTARVQRFVDYLRQQGVLGVIANSNHRDPFAAKCIPRLASAAPGLGASNRRSP